jgi:hypothetical protein
MGKFPKRTMQNQKGYAGQSYIQFFVESTINWVYHPITQNNDFGIDGYVEIIDNDCATGKMLAVQVKHGESYFKDKGLNGFTYYGEDKHLNYYLNIKCPVILIILDNTFTRKYWQLFDIELTSPEKNGWSIEIPEVNILDEKVCAKWRAFAGPIYDYEEEIKNVWEIDGKFTQGDIFMFPVTKEEVDIGSHEYLESFIKRLSKNEKMLLRMHSSMEIYFPDYQQDNRELYEISEVVRWFENAMDKKLPLAYFLSYSIDSYSFSMISYSLNRKLLKQITKNIGKITIEYDVEAFFNVLRILWDNLNIFCDKYPAAEILNEEISKGIYNSLVCKYGLEEIIKKKT